MMLPKSGNAIVESHAEMENLRYAHRETCPSCGGYGTLKKTYEEFKEWLKFRFWGGEDIVKDALSFYREWRLSGRVECSSCEGSGYTCFLW